MLRNPALCHLEWVSWEPIIINIIIRHRYSDKCKIGQQNMTGSQKTQRFLDAGGSWLTDFPNRSQLN